MDTARDTLRCLLAATFLVAGPVAFADQWPRWRGPGGLGVSHESPLPVRWSAKTNVRWKTNVPGEGFSSPIVWNQRVVVTSAIDGGTKRLVHCFCATTGRLLWRTELAHENPEVTSAMTGHAAATPVTDGNRLVAWFGNAGAVCYDLTTGRRQWHRNLGEFETELGLASSPVLHENHVILVCDHDGRRFTSFDSFLIALDLESGATAWKTDRPGLYRSWSTPVLVPTPPGELELIVSGQDHVRAYDPRVGTLLWKAGGMTEWVAPSPVFGRGLIFATSGRNGPILAVAPGKRGDVPDSHLAWSHRRFGPYVCSPLLYGDHLYVLNEQGMITCFHAATGRRVYRQRLRGRFFASPVAGDGRIYLTNDGGTTFVLKAGPVFERIAENPLGQYTLASPAIAAGCLFLRTESHLYCIPPERPSTQGQ